ncbi:MAG TPA: hypothetical protein DDZ78_05215, partial [Porphyromonadaceae bacterium]|nr:hypothetical protein [Porphyromonadaceae bacterium]
IPLYEIKVGKLTLPITLQYHAGGFKVNERATRVGLGWNLSCDLQITREINGIDDFAHNGYMNNTKMTSAEYPLFDPKNSLFPSQNTYEIAHGDIDVMPDKFYYKLLNKSGLFFILKNATGKDYSFVAVPYINIRIEFQNSNFIITDTDGTKYYFGAGDIDNGTGKEFTTDQPEGEGGGHLTSWKCVRIVNSLGREEFFFTYENRSIEKNLIKRDFIEYYSAYKYIDKDYYRSDETPLNTMIQFNNYGIPFSCVSNPKYIEYLATRTIPKLHVPYYDEATASFVDKEYDYMVDYPVTPFTALYVRGITLKEITFRGGKVIFHGADRLSQIEVTDAARQSVKTIQFYQSYQTTYNNMTEAKKYNGNNFVGTLYLDSLSMGASFIPVETYKFVYHNKFCYGNHLVGHDAWNYPNTLTREIWNQDQTSTVPSMTSPETYYFDGKLNSDKVENIPLKTSGSEWALISKEDCMRNGVIKRIVYPTGGFTDFDFEGNQCSVNLLVDRYSIYAPDYTCVFPQYCGGLRIRSINFYEPDATLPTTQKYYKYGKYENGTGELTYAPRIDTSNDLYNLSAATTSQFVAHVKWTCDNYSDNCTNRSSLAVLSIEQKKMLYPASSLDYSYGNGIFVYYTDVTEYNMDSGVHSGKTVYSYFSPKDFYVDYWNYWNYRSHISSTIIPYIKTGVYNGAQKSVSQYSFTPEGKYRLTYHSSYEYEKFEKQPKIQVAYAAFNIIYQVEGGNGNITGSGLYDDNYPSPVIESIGFPNSGSDFISGTYTIPVEKLLMKSRKEERYDSLENVTVTETAFDYDSYSQLNSTRTIMSRGNTTDTYLKYSYNFDGIYTDMRNKNMISQIIEEQVYVGGSKTKTTRNNYKKIAERSNDFIVPASIEIAYTNNPFRVETSFDEYDQYGNVVQLTGKDRVPISYLWGYWSLYPIAELKGIRYVTIPERFKSGANINIPQNETSLRNVLLELKGRFTGNSQITGYTYKWLTGMTSRIDANGTITYYEYDLYGRLVSIKDNAGQILHTYSYHVLPSTPVHDPWSVNIPQLFSVTEECPSGSKQSYNVILPGGNYSSSTTAYANTIAREFYDAGVGEGATSFPGDCNSHHIKIELEGLYDSWYLSYFYNSCTVDFFQNGSIAYSVDMTFNDLSNFTSPFFPASELYILPGTYEVSMHPYPGTHYMNGNLPLYGCVKMPNYETILIFNSMNATITFNSNTNYRIEMAPVYGETITLIEYLP